MEKGFQDIYHESWIEKKRNYFFDGKDALISFLLIYLFMLLWEEEENGDRLGVSDDVSICRFIYLSL